MIKKTLGDTFCHY